MALVVPDYSSVPFFLPGGHLQTIVPNTLRPVPQPPYQRERLVLADGDFVDLDWLLGDKNKVVILSHGLEGNSGRRYVSGAANHFSDLGWTVLAWNCRSCSGEMNRKKRLYHHGEIEDLKEVIDHVNDKMNPDTIALVGYSMGGSISLKYLGVLGDTAPKNVRCAVAFSPPARLTESVRSVELPQNIIYHKTFLRKLGKKIRQKARDFPGLVPIERLDKVKTWLEFDALFTCPINDFENPDHFYFEASSANFVDGIRRPALMVNALNDPICPPGCNPKAVAQKHDYFHLDTPDNGGHVGFSKGGIRNSWMEERAESFIQAVMEGELERRFRFL